MKKSYRITGIDCANCAARLERRLAALEGVDRLSISFLTQRLTLEAAEEHFDRVLARVADEAGKAEPDCRITR